MTRLREYRKTFFQEDPTTKPCLCLEGEAKKAFSEVYPDTVDELATNLSMSKLIDLS